MSTSLLSVEQLRQQIRVRVAQGRLPILAGIYKSHRGTGRYCLVCRHEIEFTQVEYETNGAGGVLTAHELCYMLWREESVSSRAPRRP